MQPHSVEVEQTILGCMILSREAVGHAIEHLKTAEPFYDPRHAQIWKVMTDLFERNVPVDLVTLSEELKRRGELEKVGGYSYLVGLDRMVSSTANVEHYCRIVLDKWALRRLIEAGRTIVDEAFMESVDTPTLLDRAEQRVYEIADEQMRSGFLPMRKLVLHAYSTIEEYRQRKVHVTGVPSGFIDLDEMTAGFQRSDLVVIAGRPSMGKTSFALNIAENVAAKAKEKDRYTVGVFSEAAGIPAAAGRPPRDGTPRGPFRPRTVAA